MRSSRLELLTILAAALAASGAVASQWEPVAVKGDRVEIDQARVTRQPGGTISTAWSRLALGRDFIDEQGMRYTAIEVLNRYDCAQRTTTTLRRVYRRDAQVLREETVPSSAVREVPVPAGSADEKLLAEVCKPRNATEARALARASARQAPEVPRPGKPSVMYADVRSAADGAQMRATQVADATKPAAEAPAKPPERPRFIELPKIDKSQLEDPTAKPAADAKAAGQKATAAARATERPVGARSEIERLYATSGPRKTTTTRKKAESSPDQTAAIVHKHVEWAYEGEGAPANWDKLRPDYATCGSGKRQSPIDIRGGIKVDLENIAIDYKPTHFRITDTGYTIRVDVGEGSTIRVMEREFQLLYMDFHRPSEERINGKGFDMAAHFVHRDFDGKLAVIAVVLERGSEHPLVQTLWNNMPLERGMSVEPAAVINPAHLLPPREQRAYYTYMGSLTTPPCTEDVLWMVFRQPLQVSPQQISIFARLYPQNARPVQPTNGRLIKETR